MPKNNVAIIIEAFLLVSVFPINLFPESYLLACIRVKITILIFRFKDTFNCRVKGTDGKRDGKVVGQKMAFSDSCNSITHFACSHYQRILVSWKTINRVSFVWCGLFFVCSFGIPYLATYRMVGVKSCHFCGSGWGFAWFIISMRASHLSIRGSSPIQSRTYMLQ